MANTPSPNSCTTAGPFLAEDMSSQMSPLSCTKSKSKEPSQMGEYLFQHIYSFFTYLFSVFLVTVHDPICSEDGNIEAALYGSFFPIPPESAFPSFDPAEYASQSIPGAIILHKRGDHGRITINKGRERIRIRVTNHGDRPIQVNLNIFHARYDTIEKSTDWFTLPLY